MRLPSIVTEIITPTILVMLSGGLDSISALYKIAVLDRDNYRNYDIHCHHVNIVNVENRATAERTAVHNVLQWFDDNSDLKIGYSESTMVYPVYNSEILMDTDVTKFTAGYIVSATGGNIHYVVYGTNSTDYLDDTLSSRKFRGDQIYKTFVPGESYGEHLYPIKHMSKYEAANLLPDDLKKLSWSCRRPVYENNIPSKCGKCKTCKQLVGIM